MATKKSIDFTKDLELTSDEEVSEDLFNPGIDAKSFKNDKGEISLMKLVEQSQEMFTKLAGEGSVGKSGGDSEGINLGGLNSFMELFNAGGASGASGASAGGGAEVFIGGEAAGASDAAAGSAGGGFATALAPLALFLGGMFLARSQKEKESSRKEVFANKRVKEIGLEAFNKELKENSKKSFTAQPNDSDD